MIRPSVERFLKRQRVGNNVYLGGERVYYIDANQVYDRSGVRRFYISDLWWYANDGTPSYYQHEAIPEGKGEEWPDDPPQT